MRVDRLSELGPTPPTPVSGDSEFLTGEALDARIEQIRKFLEEKLPAPGDQGNRCASTG